MPLHALPFNDACMCLAHQCTCSPTHCVCTACDWANASFQAPLLSQYAMYPNRCSATMSVNVQKECASSK